MKILNYFKELLATLKSIDNRLSKLEDCIDRNFDRKAGPYIKTGHWNTGG